SRSNVCASPPPRHRISCKMRPADQIWTPIMAAPESQSGHHAQIGAKQPESPANLPLKFGKIAVSTYIKAMFVA
ncbi:hypothetical protein, partial [Brucella melitensis]